MTLRKLILGWMLGSAGLLYSGNVAGQSEYLPGFVILANGDTLTGMIKDRKETFTGPEIYKKVRFKSGRRRKKYSPYELRGYQIDEIAYESFWLRPLRTGLTLMNAYYEIAPGAGDRVFLRVVSKGKLSHYQLEWEEGSEIATMDLFRRQQEPILIRATQGMFGLKRKNLINYFPECPALQEKIEQKEVKYPFEIVNYYNRHCP